MGLKIYNVLNRKKEDFVSIEPNKVKMYACGITASGNAHIGHAYQAVVFDMIRKYLEYLGYEVIYVRNYTDVDDKIILKAREEKVNPLTYAERLIIKTDQELLRLGVTPPTIQSRATECIEDIIKYIEKLIKKNHAYATDNGDVYFAVNSFNNYGKFSNRLLEDAISGTRKEVEPGKKDDNDFALWKNAKNDEIYWQSPWGEGRPGWHIECSTMSMKYLGDQLDIHGGGKDLIFPHHENEIAQSEALTEKRFANYWIHNGLIKVNGQKMSKSLNNSIFLSDLLNNYNSEVIRFTLLQNNYRSDVNIIDGMFETNEKILYKIYQTFYQINSKTINPINEDLEVQNRIQNEFEIAMDNDFNTSLAIANLIGYEMELSKLIKDKNLLNKAFSMKEQIIKLYKVLGLMNQDPQSFINNLQIKYLNKYNISIKEIENYINIRNDFKKNKDYNLADQTREELLNKGISLMDTKEGTIWDIVFKETN